MKIISLMNQKGGVGKTTVTVNLAASLALSDKKVLLIDADLQSNATASLGVSCYQKNDVTYDLFTVLTNQSTFVDTVQKRVVKHHEKKANLDVLPATIALSGFDQLVRALPNKQLLVKQMLQEIKKTNTYDYILIDCPPSLGLLTINALVASDEIIIPVQPEFFALQGLSQLLDTVQLLQDTLNPQLEIGGIVCTRYNRRRIHNEVVSCLEDRFDKKLFSTKIYENIAVAEAPSYGKTVFEYNPYCVGANDFDLLCREVLNKQVSKKTIQQNAANTKQKEL